jgi:hypothetical protein
MNVVPAVEALDGRAMSLRKKENVRRRGKQVGGYGLIESNRMHSFPAEDSRG